MEIEGAVLITQNSSPEEMALAQLNACSRILNNAESMQEPAVLDIMVEEVSKMLKGIKRETSLLDSQEIGENIASVEDQIEKLQLNN